MEEKELSFWWNDTTKTLHVLVRIGTDKLEKKQKDKIRSCFYGTF